MKQDSSNLPLARPGTPGRRRHDDPEPGGVGEELYISDVELQVMTCHSDDDVAVTNQIKSNNFFEDQSSHRGSRPRERLLMSLSSEAGEKAKSEFQDYLTIRIYIPHVDVRSMLEKVFKDVDYICYRHKGAKTHKEHVHVLVTDVTMQKKLKDRLRLAGFKGNEGYSIKGMHNGLHAGIQYCAKEGGVPLSNWDSDSIIEEAPKWVDRKLDPYVKYDAKPRIEREWQLSYTNLVPQAVSYARQNGLTEMTLKEVVRHMRKFTKWSPCDSMRNRGVHYSYDRDFEFRMGRGGEWPDMEWWEQRGRF